MLLLSWEWDAGEGRGVHASTAGMGWGGGSPVRTVHIQGAVHTCPSPRLGPINQILYPCPYTL